MAGFQVIMYGRFWVITEVNLPTDVAAAINNSIVDARSASTGMTRKKML